MQINNIRYPFVTPSLITLFTGFVNSFLSYELLHPLSRLTYCAYLVHPIIMTMTNFQMDAPLHLQDSIIVRFLFIISAYIRGKIGEISPLMKV